MASVIFHSDDSGSDAIWNFIETAHGQGAVDGVGGSVWLGIL